MNLKLGKYDWSTFENVHSCGYVLENDVYLRGDDLAVYFSKCLSKEELIIKLKNSNGQFSLVIFISDIILIACDKTRAYPLFYHAQNDIFEVSDSCYKLIEDLPEPRFSEKNAIGFLLSGFTYNNGTLIEDVFQVEAGELVWFEKEISRLTYYSYYDNQPEIPGGNKADNLAVTLEDVFRQHLIALRNDNLVIPLSGGYDSRFIALMCKKYHPDNTILYSYGSKESPEMSIARRVASKLDLKWIPIVYDKEVINDFIHCDDFKTFYKYSSELSSSFFFQEYFAVRLLKTRSLIPGNSVFIPGFSGDVISGGHLKPGYKSHMSANKIIREIFRQYYILLNADKGQKSLSYSQIALKIPDKLSAAHRVIENWEYKERQAKLITNSANVFNYFGYTFSLPFWDTRLVDFFSGTCFEEKLYSRLYHKTLADRFYKPEGLTFVKEITPGERYRKYQDFKNIIKTFLPDRVIDLVTGDNDNLNYKYITGILFEDMPEEIRKRPARKSYYNSIISQWYLYKVRNELFHPQR